jgi:hypothetical protein
MIARYAIPFFMIMGLVVVPLLLVLLCRWLMPKRHWCKGAFACTLIIWGLVLFGHFVGYQDLEVHRYDFVSKDLPQSFDGYRIVQFSDAHIATMSGSRQWLLQRAVDSINALQPDVIVFTGDLQNLHPDELDEFKSVLRQLHAKDGVYSVLGNHDYPTYLDCDEATKETLLRQTIQFERELGWRLLLNEHSIIRRDSDSIVIAGMENWGKPKRMPRRGDVAKTLAGLSANSSPFILMLQHDPTAWREKILPQCQPQLTLSGHTHGGQFQLFGWSPAALSYEVWGGWAYEDRCALFVSTGLGALIPFRLGVPGEIVQITLKKRS